MWHERAITANSISSVCGAQSSVSGKKHYAIPGSGGACAKTPSKEMGTVDENNLLRALRAKRFWAIIINRTGRRALNPRHRVRRP
jgi:hypothetical protein